MRRLLSIPVFISFSITCYPQSKEQPESNNADYKKSFAASLQLYDLTKKKKYLEDAFYFDQLSKTLSPSLNKEEIDLLKFTASDLFQQESFLKSSIIQLSLKAAQINDSIQLLKINSSIHDLDTKLGKIVKKINSTTVPNTIHLSSRVPAVQSVKKMLDETTALLSYHLSESEIVTMIITKNDFLYYRNPVNALFHQQIDSLLRMLNNSPAINRNQISLLSAELYRHLINPVQNKLSSAKRLIIIPADKLLNLPFDILLDSEKKYLIEKFSIQYLYSTALLTGKKQSLNDQGTLAFAPFINNNYTDNNFTLSRLPETGKEIENLNGVTFTDSAATKEKFLSLANSQGILHLATHTQFNNQNPLQSFIVFYTKHNDSVDSKLYAREIYNLRLDSTRLIILSAGETREGQLLNGEGLTCINRAFSYAGCSNVITSLWKASDQTTAIIISKLHYYLSRGFSADMALQKAKIDLLHNSTIDPRLKQPNYWAHLVSTGNYEPIRHGLQWRWVAISTILMMLIYYFTKKTTKRFPVNQN